MEELTGSPYTVSVRVGSDHLYKLEVSWWDVQIATGWYSSLDTLYWMARQVIKEHREQGWHTPPTMDKSR